MGVNSGKMIFRWWALVTKVLLLPELLPHTTICQSSVFCPLLFLSVRSTTDESDWSGC